MTSDHDSPVPLDPRPGFRLASPDDWLGLVRTRANVLITGPEDALAAFLTTAAAEWREPIGWVVCGQALPVERLRTMILQDLQRLDDAGQQALWAWMNQPQNADTQVVSVTYTPLFDLVQANCFDRALYYRLNTIHLKAEPPG